VFKRDYTLRMNVKEEIFEIRSCIEILANDIKVNTADRVYALQLTENCKVYILEDLHPLGGKNNNNRLYSTPDTPQAGVQRHHTGGAGDAPQRLYFPFPQNGVPYAP